MTDASGAPRLTLLRGDITEQHVDAIVKSRT